MLIILKYLITTTFAITFSLKFLANKKEKCMNEKY